MDRAFEEKISSKEYQQYHKLYMNGTSKKVGNVIIDRIQCLYNEAGCRIVYVYRHYDDINRTNTGFIAYTPLGAHEIFASTKAAKEWLDNKCYEELIFYGIDKHDKVRKISERSKRNKS